MLLKIETKTIQTKANQTLTLTTGIACESRCTNTTETVTIGIQTPLFLQGLGDCWHWLSKVRYRNLNIINKLFF